MTLSWRDGILLGVVPERVWRFLRLAARGFSRKMVHRVFSAPRLFYEATTISAEDDTSPLTEFLFACLAILLGIWMYTTCGDWALILQNRAANMRRLGFLEQARNFLEASGLYLFLQTWSPALILSGISTHLGFFFPFVPFRKAGSLSRLFCWGVAGCILLQTPYHGIVGGMLLVFLFFSLLCYLRLSRLPTWRHGG